MLDGQQCPDFGERPVTGAWPLPDPAKFMGSDVERATMINELYGMIRAFLTAHEESTAGTSPWEYALIAYPVSEKTHA